MKSRVKWTFLEEPEAGSPVIWGSKAGFDQLLKFTRRAIADGECQVYPRDGLMHFDCVRCEEEKQGDDLDAVPARRLSAGIATLSGNRAGFDRLVECIHKAVDHPDENIPLEVEGVFAVRCTEQFPSHLTKLPKAVHWGARLVLFVLVALMFAGLAWLAFFAE